MGKLAIAAIPMPPLRVLAPESKVTFREATFDEHGLPTYVPNGDSFIVTLTMAKDSGATHHGLPIYTIEW